jgi:hypothetical protein
MEPKKPMSFSKEFIALVIAVATVIFGAGANYAKLASLESSFSEFKRSNETQTALVLKAQNDQTLANKLLEMRVLSLEQNYSNQPQNKRGH